MKKRLVLFLAFIPIIVTAQEKGVQFEHSLSWTEIQKKAKAENKYIFVHCYTSYCAPSRYMTTTIYPTDEAGSFMNDKFISVKMQLDTAASDDSQVKSWYNASHEIAETYGVRASPTYLVFDPDGQPVHRFIGQVQTPAEFIEKTRRSFDPSSQYFVLLNEYKRGKKDSAFLHKMTNAVTEAYDTANMQLIINDYLDTQKDLYTRENLTLLGYVTRTSRDRGFRVALNNPEKVNEILGKGVAERRTHNIIIAEEIAQKYGDMEPDWNDVTPRITKKYPAQADEIVAKSKFLYYRYKEDWDRFQFALANYMKKYENKCDLEELNRYAWMIFENCTDANCLAEAANWSKHSFQDNNEPAFIDTYANLLYKLGKKEQAITWETTAMELAPADQKGNYKDTIDKMKAGRKTWK